MLPGAQNFMMAGKRLPYDAQVEYIESTGTQYIDTGVTVSTTTGTGFEISAKFLSGASGVFGTNLPYPRYGNEQYTRFQFGRRDNVVGSTMLFQGILSRNYYRTPPIDYSSKHIFKFVPSISNQFYIDDSGWPIGDPWGDVHIPTGTGTFFLFANCANNAVVGDTSIANLFCKAQCFYAKFYEGGVLVRDFIPVRVGDVGEMYDRVNDTFAERHGTFLFGSDVGDIRKEIDRI